MDAAVEAVIGNGILGALLVLAGIWTVWRETRFAKVQRERNSAIAAAMKEKDAAIAAKDEVIAEVQNARVADAQRVSQQLLAMSEDTNGVASESATVLDRVAMRLESLERELAHDRRGDRVPERGRRT